MRSIKAEKDLNEKKTVIKTESWLTLKNTQAKLSVQKLSYIFDRKKIN